MKEFTTLDGVTIQYSMVDLTLQVGKEQKVECSSKSDMFRHMYDAGMEICDIARECASHYSFVYGVISNGREVRKVEKVSASDTIREMYKEGKKPGEIAKQLNKNYSFVFSVIKKYKASLPIDAQVAEDIAE